MTRLYRSARILHVAATVYASYKLPEVVSWTLGRRHGGGDGRGARAARHRRNAESIFDTALACAVC